MDALKSKGQMLDQINLEQIPRSGFDLSYNNKGTGKIGRIIPIRCMETLPGDSIKGSTQIAMQFEPLAVPILANMRLKNESWYVPNNIIWDGWDKFITKGQDLSDTSKVPSFALSRAYSMFIGAQLKNSLLKNILRYGTFQVSSMQEYDAAALARYNDLKNRVEKYQAAGKDLPNKEKGEYYRDSHYREMLTELASLKILVDKEVSYYCVNAGLQVDRLIQFVEGLKHNRKWEDYEIDDLMDYRTTVCDQFLNLIANTPKHTVKIGNGYQQVIFLYQMQTKDLDKDGNIEETAEFIPRDYVEYKNNTIRAKLSNVDYNLSSHEEKLIDAFITVNEGHGDDLAWMYLPNDFYRSLIQFMYDYISPVLGLGSNLDYLGYRVLRPVDMSYLMQLHIANMHQNLYAAHTDTGTPPAVTSVPYASYTIGGDKFYPANSRVNNQEQSILPLRAMYAIWWNNYRDQLLETKSPEPCTISTVSDGELLHLLVPRQRAWSKDTFTTALANTGTGNMVVPVSDVLKKGSALQLSNVSSLDNNAVQNLGLAVNEITLSTGEKIDLPTRFLEGLSKEGVSASKVTQYAFSLDTLRRAGRTEKWIQKALIYGNRIQDALFTHWGVKIKNERLQLPEFVTSSVQLVKIDTILNNTTTTESIAGDKAGFASAYDQGNSFDFYSPENGFLITLMSVLPEQSYPGGTPRFLNKLSIFDYAFPEFAQIGMDAVYIQEISQLPTLYNYDDRGVFGYQGRYYDYKCKQDEEHGELCSTQDMYTFGREFNLYKVEETPKLNYRFIHCFPPLDMFVVDDKLADQFRYDIHHSVACSRALPVCGMSV